MPVSSKKKIVQLCRKLRQDATEAEDLLWQSLRNRKLSGLKFNRQFPIIYFQTVDAYHFFVADFYCHKKSLVVELDGPIHDFQKEYDENRERILRKMGLRVIRFKNEELEENVLKVLERIREAVR